MLGCHRLAVIAGAVLLLMFPLAACRSRERLAPLDSKLHFTFEEKNNVITLQLWTDKIYDETESYTIGADLRQTGSHVLHVTIRGIVLCIVCNAGSGPARQEITLPSLDGNYTLLFDYQNEQTDTYALKVNARQISLAPTGAISLHIPKPLALALY
jgi:hypothetical protein